MIQSSAMIGTILNTTAIVLGGTLGLTVARDLSPTIQHRLKLALGAFIIFAGFSTTWGAINGRFGPVLKQIMIVMLALILGNIVGKLLRLQKGLNRLGRHARERLAGEPGPGRGQAADGFVTCALLFCVGPMAILGALEDGLTGNFRTLGIKAVLDGLSAMAFARMFGWGVLLSALPVLAYQGTITLAAAAIQPLLAERALLDSVSATGGLLVSFIALIVLDVKKVPLGDYLPSLIIAPLLTAWWR